MEDSLRPANALSTVGVMARPAGVAGIMASGPISISDAFDGRSSSKGSSRFEHALRRHSPYAEVAPSSWGAREPGTHPHQSNSAAGVVSAGSIDNTYLPSPLKNSWGKARELARREVLVPPKQQATDLLVTTKGAYMPPPYMTLSDVNTVNQLVTRTLASLALPAPHLPVPPNQPPTPLSSSSPFNLRVRRAFLFANSPCAGAIEY